MASSLLKTVFLILFVAACKAQVNFIDMGDAYEDMHIDGDDHEYLDLNDTLGPYPELDKNGIIGEQYRWTNGRVPYTFSGTFSSTELSTIQQAMNRIKSASGDCVQFVPKAATDTHFVTITKISALACASHVGKLANPGNAIFYHPACFLKYGTILHEMLHTLGFYHEHQRSDRWFFVCIIENNIRTGAEGNFERKETQSFGVPYDYDSVMHYPATAFAKTSGALTIYPFWRPFNIDSLGQRTDLSERDIQKIKKMYC